MMKTMMWKKKIRSNMSTWMIAGNRILLHSGQQKKFGIVDYYLPKKDKGIQTSRKISFGCH